MQRSIELQDKGNPVDSLERNIQQASRSLRGKVVLNRMEQWISRAAVIEATERPTRDGGVEVRVAMRMRPGNVILTEITENGHQILRAPWEAPEWPGM